MRNVSLLIWSLKLDRDLLFKVPILTFGESLGLICLKYLLFMRDLFCRDELPRKALFLKRRYLYNDRYGVGSLQRVFCSSWKLKKIVSYKPNVVDVGANLGQFNIFCKTCLEAERIISVEPVPACYKLLIENVDEPADCLNALVTENEEERIFYISDDSQLSSVINDELSVRSYSIHMKGIPLDQLLEGKGLDRVDLLKIDTEGSELEVLRSAEKTLEKTKVVLVEMSIFRKNLGNIFAVGSFLESKGFRLTELVFGEMEHPQDVDGIFVKV